MIKVKTVNRNLHHVNGHNLMENEYHQGYPDKTSGRVDAEGAASLMYTCQLANLSPHLPTISCYFLVPGTFWCLTQVTNAKPKQALRFVYLFIYYLW